MNYHRNYTWFLEKKVQIHGTITPRGYQSHPGVDKSLRHEFLARGNVNMLIRPTRGQKDYNYQPCQYRKGHKVSTPLCYSYKSIPHRVTKKPHTRTVSPRCSSSLVLITNQTQLAVINDDRSVEMNFHVVCIVWKQRLDAMLTIGIHYATYQSRAIARMISNDRKKKRCFRGVAAVQSWEMAPSCS